MPNLPRLGSHLQMKVSFFVNLSPAVDASIRGMLGRKVLMITFQALGDSARANPSQLQCQRLHGAPYYPQNRKSQQVIHSPKTLIGLGSPIYTLGRLLGFN
jgi:hypothetical protein